MPAKSEVRGKMKRKEKLTSDTKGFSENTEPWSTRGNKRPMILSSVTGINKRIQQRKNKNEELIY